jgi:hypothetical protein
MNNADFFTLTVVAFGAIIIVFMAFVGVIRWVLKIDRIVELLEQIAKECPDEQDS